MKSPNRRNSSSEDEDNKSSDDKHSNHDDEDDDKERKKRQMTKLDPLEEKLIKHESLITSSSLLEEMKKKGGKGGKIPSPKSLHHHLSPKSKSNSSKDDLRNVKNPLKSIKTWICPKCSKPDDGSPMIGCDACDLWYHWCCVGIIVAPKKELEWLCPFCAKRRAAKAFEAVLNILPTQPTTSSFSPQPEEQEESSMSPTLTSTRKSHPAEESFDDKNKKKKGKKSQKRKERQTSSEDDDDQESESESTKEKKKARKSNQPIISSLKRGKQSKELSWNCTECGMSIPEERMIGCDSCDSWFHYKCVRIKKEPKDCDSWFCPLCIAKASKIERTKR